MLQPLPPLAFLHLHATTGSARTRRILDIAVIRVDSHGVQEWSRLLNPERPIHPLVQARTGISSAMVARAPLFEELARELTGMLSGHMLVADDARVQYGVLKAAFARMDAPFDARLLCTRRLSHTLFPQEARHDLRALASRHGLAAAREAGRDKRPTPGADGDLASTRPAADAGTRQAQSALVHARIAMQFWEKLRCVVGHRKLENVVRAVARLPAPRDSAATAGAPPAEAPPTKAPPAKVPPVGVPRAVQAVRDESVPHAAPAMQTTSAPREADPATPRPVSHGRAPPRYAWRLAPDLISGTLTLVELDAGAAARPDELYGDFASKAQARRWLRALSREHGIREVDGVASETQSAGLLRALHAQRPG